MEKKYSLGVDIGGSHISCALINLEQEEILKESLVSIAVNNKAEADIIVETWIKALNKSISIIEKKQLAGIGFAMPGPFDYMNGIGLFKGVAKYEKLYGINIADRIRTGLEIDENVKVRFVNDATAFAIGESWMGKAKSYSRSVAITLGTGFGSAFIENEIPVVEGENVPEQGCVWHLPFKTSIADEYFSTRWFVNRYFELTGISAPGVKDIADLAKEGNNAMALFQEFGENLAAFLFPHLLKFGTEVLVIGGNVSAAYPLFENSINGYKKSNDNIDIKIFISELREEAALIGGAKLMNENYWEHILPLLPKM